MKQGCVDSKRSVCIAIGWVGGRNVLMHKYIRHWNYNLMVCGIRGGSSCSLHSLVLFYAPPRRSPYAPLCVTCFHSLLILSTFLMKCKAHIDFIIMWAHLLTRSILKIYRLRDFGGNTSQRLKRDHNIKWGLSVGSQTEKWGWNNVHQIFFESQGVSVLPVRDNPWAAYRYKVKWLFGSFLLLSYSFLLSKNFFSLTLYIKYIEPSMFYDAGFCSSCKWEP